MSENEYFSAMAIDQYVRIIIGKNFFLDFVVLHHQREEKSVLLKWPVSTTR
jgi:hypothetical protein